MMFWIFLPPVALCLREHRPSRQPFHEPDFNLLFFITIVHNEKRTILEDSCVVVTMSPVSPKDAIQAQPVAHRFLWMFQYIFNSGWIVGACNGTKGRVLFPTDLQLIVKGKHFVRREHQPSDNISVGPLSLIWSIITRSFSPCVQQLNLTEAVTYNTGQEEGLRSHRLALESRSHRSSRNPESSCVAGNHKQISRLRSHRDNHRGRSWDQICGWPFCAVDKIPSWNPTTIGWWLSLDCKDEESPGAKKMLLLIAQPSWSSLNCTR